ncbi:hypothetical protein VNI00_007018 [Paramarasmius palmivorus]|uniref:Hydrophobin n=1 Tax=Paramarasmius palmivorus TaxID=297713 RepID=A0AAW0D5G5_9AGAR
MFSRILILTLIAVNYVCAAPSVATTDPNGVQCAPQEHKECCKTYDVVTENNRNATLDKIVAHNPGKVVTIGDLIIGKAVGFECAPVGVQNCASSFRAMCCGPNTASGGLVNVALGCNALL